MRKSLILTLILFLSVNAFAQTDSVLLWPDGAPGLLPDHQKVENWYTGRDGMKRVGNVTAPMIYPFIPEGATENTPAVIICPGGGYRICSMTAEGFNEAKWFNERGIAAFVVKYRLPNNAFADKKIVPLQDVQKAFMYVHENAEKYNIKTDCIGVMGFSAGGHLAASTSTLYKTPLVYGGSPELLRPAFSILVYPVITFNENLTHKGSRDNLIGLKLDPAMVNYYSTELQIDSMTPPAFLIHAKDDHAVPYENSMLYHSALRKNGVSSTLVFLEKGGHGFGYKPKSPYNFWLENLEAWLKAQNILPPTE